MAPDYSQSVRWREEIGQLVFFFFLKALLLYGGIDMRAFSREQIKIAVDSKIDSMEMSTIMEIVTDERMDYYCNHADD